MGPIILDLAGLELSTEEREILKHPQIGGIIFFARNYESPEQLLELALQIRASSKERLLLTVDQEGGRVQRFYTGLTPLPSLERIGQLYKENPEEAKLLAETQGWLMASEILSLGVDLSFAPILDLDNGLNQVIGNRSFNADPMIVTQLARAAIQGMNNAGMCAVGKHFPGHGSVSSDTHTHFTIDSREYTTIEKTDLIPFTRLSPYLGGMMASHIVYSEADPLPCGFSSFWLQTILRKKLNFSGAIFTDDLSMLAVQQMGSISERVQLALHAGCDGLLICNNRKDAISALEYLENDNQSNKATEKRLQKLFPRRTLGDLALRQTLAWCNAVDLLSKLNDN